MRRDYIVSVLEGFYRHAPGKPPQALAALLDTMVKYMDLSEEECERAWEQHKAAVVGVTSADANCTARSTETQGAAGVETSPTQVWPMPSPGQGVPDCIDMLCTQCQPWDTRAVPHLKGCNRRLHYAGTDPNGGGQDSDHRSTRGGTSRCKTSRSGSTHRSVTARDPLAMYICGHADYGYDVWPYRRGSRDTG